MLNKEDKELLLSKIDNEGFDYCFINYSSWENIKDGEFHKLREAYIEAASALKEYIGEED